MRDDALFALRLWRDADRGSPWRAQVTDLRGGGVTTFADVPSFLRYLSEAFAADEVRGGSASADGGDDRPVPPAQRARKS